MNVDFFLRKYLIICFLTIVTLFGASHLHSQGIDQLESQLSTLEGLEKTEVHLKLSQAYLNNDESKSIFHAKEVLEYGKNNQIISLQSYANLLLAQAHFLKGDYQKSIDFSNDALDYLENNDFENYYTIKELQGDVYFEQKQFQKAVNEFTEVFKYYEKNKNFKSAGFAASKIGSSFEKLKKYSESSSWHEIAYKNFEKSGNVREMVLTQSILGGVYSNYGDYTSAKNALINARDLAKKYNMVDELNEIEKRLSRVGTNELSNEKSTTDFQRDLSDSQNQKLKSVINQRAKTLEEIEKLSEEKQLIELKIKVQQDEYEKNLLTERLEKLEIEKDLKQEKLEKKNLKLALDNEKLLSEKKTVENQRLFISLGALLLIIVLVLLALMIKNRSNRKLAQKNKEIQRQKSEIEAKQENINQSITYASRIQEAILPTQDTLINSFKDAFVYLNPKEQVSGDFLWTFKHGDHLFVCVADCTGHGVPGAFMSIIFNNILDEIVKKEGVYDPAEALERATKLLIDKVKEQNQNISNFKDGMDAVLMKVDFSSRKVLFSGAKNGLIIIRNNELKEFKGERRSIDVLTVPNDKKVNFNTQLIDFQEGDTFYLFTDGFVDQKGGADNSKFYRKNFRKLLLDISNKKMESQKSIIHNTFVDWSGNNEQVDDILIVGFKM